MTDLEMVCLCAEAMELETLARDDGSLYSYLYFDVYDPLNDDAQAMALDDVILREHVIYITRRLFMIKRADNAQTFYILKGPMTAENRRRARVECIAKMQPAKVKP